ncbi:HPr family phosphocarrier protein [Brevibacillus humidisoli]|uniref:HPr family phosphocarrier protein n=1 Tax=Brevibacillus humidisoli TaxID=2895522 RepID=UPI001E39331C|nr:HPr family phosphocarrier protein [Brevibacillus humidisoli]UFJ39099.1 HPr family phosphocarrier protein [Brevibacillus humidisoli]
MIEKKIVVQLEQGLHARPAAAFAQKATSFTGEISISNGGKSVNGKSIVGIMSLAVKKGDEVVIAADGPDEREAIACLERLLVDGDHG